VFSPKGSSTPRWWILLGRALRLRRPLLRRDASPRSRTFISPSPLLSCVSLIAPGSRNYFRSLFPEMSLPAPNLFQERRYDLCADAALLADRIFLGTEYRFDCTSFTLQLASGRGRVHPQAVFPCCRRHISRSALPFSMWGGE